jgi:hypothetical protein
MSLTDRAIGTIGRRAASDSEVERTRQRIVKMSDAELLRFGLTTKYKCSRELRPPDHPQLEVLAVQLNEARAEWKRRNPMLPLSDSF